MSIAVASITSIVEAAAALCAGVRTVACETVPWQQAAGRILAAPVRLDRPSPACDVSAMDGYAVRLAEAARGDLPVRGEVAAGQPAEPLPPGAAVRIFTGAMVPPGTEAIIPREQLREGDAQIALPSDLAVRPGQHIRRAGENAAAGAMLAAEGTLVTAPVLAAIAACGMTQVSVYKRLRVGLLVTGGEVRRTDEAPAAWCLRDANGPALTGLLAPLPWATVAPVVQVADEPAALATDMAGLLAESDALLVTGGVSAGDYDYVPETIRRLGHRTVFHHLAIRPGKPVLGALTADGRPLLALPGNPVSAMVTARLLALPALAWRAGRRGSVAAELVTVKDDATAPARLTWYPLVRVTAPGQAEVVNGMGSGDWVAAAASDGFIEVPPGAAASGLRRLYRWTP